jgi:hypothetical protein
MLSKYQALVPLSGLLFALVWSGSLRSPAQRAGLALAIATMLAVFAPHAAWVVQHDFSTLRYASEAVESANLLQRLGFLVSFFANQVRIVFPSLLTMAICGYLMRRGDLRRPEAVVTRDVRDVPSREFGVWSFGLIGVTVCVLIVMAIGAGVSLRNHWGVQTFQFLCLWLAYRWDRGTPIDLRRLLQVALLVQGVSLAIYAAEHRDPHGLISKRRIDTMYPAQRIADAAAAHWRESTNCPLRYVGGDVFIAGMASLYSPVHPQVFDSPAATPWVSTAALERDGMLYVVDEDDTLPAGVQPPKVFNLVLDEQVHKLAKTIRFAVKLPAAPCG